MDHAAALVDENALFAALAATADPDTPVPTCPGWSLKQLFRHVGRGDRWAATIVRTGAARRSPGGGRRAAAGGRAGRLAARRAAGGPRRRGRGRAGHPGVDVHRPAARVLVDPQARARGAGAPGRRGARPRGRLRGCPPSARPTACPNGSACWRRAGPSPPTTPLADGATLHLHATDDGLGPAGEWLVRGAGGASRGSTGTPRATSPSAGRPPTSCSRCCAADRPTASRRSATRAVWERWLARTGF